MCHLLACKRVVWSLAPFIWPFWQTPQNTLPPCSVLQLSRPSKEQLLRPAAEQDVNEPKRKRRHRLFGRRRKGEEPQQEPDTRHSDEEGGFMALAHTIRDKLSVKHRRRKAMRKKAAAGELEVCVAAAMSCSASLNSPICRLASVARQVQPAAGAWLCAGATAAVLMQHVSFAVIGLVCAGQ